MTAIDVLDGTEPKPDIRPEVIPTYRPPPGPPVPRDPPPRPRDDPPPREPPTWPSEPGKKPWPFGVAG